VIRKTRRAGDPGHRSIGRGKLQVSSKKKKILLLFFSVVTNIAVLLDCSKCSSRQCTVAFLPYLLTSISSSLPLPLFEICAPRPDPVRGTWSHGPLDPKQNVWLAIFLKVNLSTPTTAVGFVAGAQTLSGWAAVAPLFVAACALLPLTCAGGGVAGARAGAL